MGLRMFGVADLLADGLWEVDVMVPPVSEKHYLRLPSCLCDELSS
jgi:hypothetical protein